jgi:two-component system sensor histidine kinase YesM
MLEQLQSLTAEILNTQEELYKAELAKKEAELSALQSQINPHFLYNTLDCIRVIAYTHNVQEIVAISSSMAMMFRYCIRRDHTVAIKDEIDCISNYMDIIQIRYDKRFGIEKNIDSRILSVKMTKFILQPIIENAVCHGLERKQGPGTMRLTGKLEENGDILFEVFDTGIGIEMDALIHLNEQISGNETREAGFALVNINRRLKNVYGPKYGLSIESEYGKWCNVKIRIGQL